MSLTTRNLRQSFIAACLLASACGTPAVAEPSSPPASRFAALRAAILDLSATFGVEYPGGGEFLARLERLERLAVTASAADVVIEAQREQLAQRP